MSDSDTPTTALEIARLSVAATRRAVLGEPARAARDPDSVYLVGDAKPPDPQGDAFADAKAKAMQAVAQAAVIAVQDAVEMVRNVSTVEVTAVGAATAKWIEEPENVLYAAIIETSMANIEVAATAMGTIAETASAMIGEFNK